MSFLTPNELHIFVIASPDSFSTWKEEGWGERVSVRS
jgi:hypothetical protein